MFCTKQVQIKRCTKTCMNLNFWVFDGENLLAIAQFTAQSDVFF